MAPANQPAAKAAAKKAAKKAAAKKAAAKKAPAKKAPAKKAAAKAPAILDKSPCELRGEENAAEVFAHQGQQILAFFLLCAAKATMRFTVRKVDPASTGSFTKIEGTIPDPENGLPNPFTVPLGPLAKGRYIINWLFTPVGDFQAVAELQVDGVTLFRKREDLEDKIPTTKIFCILEIL